LQPYLRLDTASAIRLTAFCRFASEVA